MKWNEGCAYPALATSCIQYKLADVNICVTAKLLCPEMFMPVGYHCCTHYGYTAPVELDGSLVCAKTIWTLEIKS